MRFSWGVSLGEKERPLTSKMYWASLTHPPIIIQLAQFLMFFFVFISQTAIDSYHFSLVKAPVHSRRLHLYTAYVVLVRKYC